jgi:hypothetical protein
MAKRKTTTKRMSAAEQSAAFKAMARELGTDERPESFDKLVKRTVKPVKPK